MRDDFTQSTKDLLANRVGYMCSNPKCRRMTRGASKNEEKFINIGVAAHICAASFGGPRFNGNMTQEERKSPNNGIWLCQNCAKMIDSDVNKYSVELLRYWKTNAERYTIQMLECNNKGKDLNIQENLICIKIFVDMKNEIQIKDDSSYNNLFRWFTNSFKEKIKIELEYEVYDKIMLFESHLTDDDMNIRNMTIEQRKAYSLYIRCKEELIEEIKYRELAINFFVKDVFFLTYYNPVSIENILKMISLIIQDIGNNNGYDHDKETLIDCYIVKNVKRNIDKDYNFSLPINTNLLKEIFKVDFLQFISGDVASLGYDLVINKIASRFYLFLAEIYTYGDRELLNNSYFMNMFNYQIGLH